MKKRFLLKASAIISALILICISAVPAFAAKAVKVKVEIAGSDGLLYVRLTAPASSDISTFSAPLRFDSNKLKFEKISYLEDDSIINSTNAEKADEGLVIGNIVIAEKLTEETKIFTYVFKILDGAEGDVKFSFGDIVATNGKNEHITILTDGSLTSLLTSLTPLSPDKLQSSFEPVKPSETEPTSANKPQNADKPNIPNTTGKIAAVSVVSVALAAAIVISAVAVKKKKEN